MLNKDEDRFYDEVIRVFENEIVIHDQNEHGKQVHTVEKPSAIKSLIKEVLS